MQTENQPVEHPILSEKQVSLSIKREDLIHSLISGNKYRKLKYNIKAAKEQKQSVILTYGGAYSNHIAATAFAAHSNNLRSIGIIRGEELVNLWQENDTLKLAHEHGMRFKFISRTAYREKTSPSFKKELKHEFGDFYEIPEGGSNTVAIRGCEEILGNLDESFDVVCCAVGTGGTIAGIINSSYQHQKILGFPALKGDFLKEDIRNFTTKENWELHSDYHFGGYAKVSDSLIHFINDFKQQTQIPLDPVYTGKMVFGIFDLIQMDYFKPNTKILAIHTGGLQGIDGMNKQLIKKRLPQIL